MLFRSLVHRTTKEDEHFIKQNLYNNDKQINSINFFGVFDGHGGKKISTYLKNYLPNLFLQKVSLL